MSKWEIRELYQVEKTELKAQNIDELRVYICPNCRASVKHPVLAENRLNYCSYCGENMQESN